MAYSFLTFCPSWCAVDLQAGGKRQIPTGDHPLLSGIQYKSRSGMKAEGDKVERFLQHFQEEIEAYMEHFGGKLLH